MTKPKSWRDVLPVHPAAEMFPPMATDELREPGEDIKRSGLTAPIVFSGSGPCDRQLLDGRNRLDAMEAVGLRVLDEEGQLTCGREDVSFFLADGSPAIVYVGDIDPYAYVLSANLHRRHLTAEQKRDLIAKLIQAQPERSNRQIAEQVKASHPHVAKVRAEMEAAGDVETVTTSIDTKGRKQPAKKKAKQRAAAPEPEDDPDDQTPEEIARAKYDGFLFGVREVRGFAKQAERYDGPIDLKLVEMVEDTARRWNAAANIMRGRLTRSA
jgi:hypothetical protein